MWLFFLILLCGVAQADVYVITAPDKSVYSLSEADDAVIPAGYNKNIIPNKKISDLTVTMGEEKLYDFNGNKFTPNAKKVQDRNKVDSDNIIASQKKDTDKASASVKLKSLGFTDDEIKVIFR